MIEQFSDTSGCKRGLPVGAELMSNRDLEFCQKRLMQIADDAISRGDRRSEVRTLKGRFALLDDGARGALNRWMRYEIEKREAARKNGVYRIGMRSTTDQGARVVEVLRGALEVLEQSPAD